MAIWLLSFLLLVTLALAQRPSQVCLLVPPETDACYKELQGTMLTDRAAQVNCLQKLLWNFQENGTMTEQDQAALMALVDSGQERAGLNMQGGRQATYMYPSSGYRTRKEYRTLSHAERRRFHRALDQLYREGTVAMFARIHALAADKHHTGASFLPWHRVFLAYFEESLRRVDPYVSLPYWDYTIDNDMPNPVNSILWAPQYFGNGVGEVTSGPSAYWVTNQGRLQRDYGKMSRLMSKDDLRRVLTRCRLHDISRPTARTRYDLERMHDGVHVWVGGDMGAVSTAAYDILFYLHHAYIDLVWEMFRRNQISRCRINPEVDYPIAASGSHGPDEPMVAFTWLRNSDGLANYWTQNWYGYEDPPACPTCCPRCPFPQPMFCNRRKRVCVSRSRRIFPIPEPVAPGAEPSMTEIIIPTAIEADVRQDVLNEATLVPRNRGRLFEGPPSDGRTRSTALEDAFRAAADLQRDAREFDMAVQGTGGQSLDLQPGGTAGVQESVSAESQRTASLQGQRGVSFEGQRGVSVEGQRGVSAEVQRGASLDVQRGGSLNVQGGGSLEGQRGGSVSVQRGASVDAQRAQSVDARRTGSVEAARSGSVEGQRSGSVEAQRSGSFTGTQTGSVAGQSGFV